MAFVAHIVTRTAAGASTSAEVAVTEADERTGVVEPIISYPLPAGARVADAIALLCSRGWSLYGARRYMEPGYWIVQVQAQDWPVIVRAVLEERQQAEIRSRCCQSAYNTVLSAALGDRRTVKAALAEITGTRCEGVSHLRYEVDPRQGVTHRLG
jgi:hypothetical protein